jgi:hypothetical protein
MRPPAVPSKQASLVPPMSRPITDSALLVVKGFYAGSFALARTASLLASKSPLGSCRAGRQQTVNFRPLTG